MILILLFSLVLLHGSSTWGQDFVCGFALTSESEGVRGASRHHSPAHYRSRHAAPRVQSPRCGCSEPRAILDLPAPGIGSSPLQSGRFCLLLDSDDWSVNPITPPLPGNAFRSNADFTAGYGALPLTLRDPLISGLGHPSAAKTISARRTKPLGKLREFAIQISCARTGSLNSRGCSGRPRAI